MSTDENMTNSIQKTRKMRLLYLGFLAGAMAGGQVGLAQTPNTGRPIARTLESHNVQILVTARRGNATQRAPDAQTILYPVSGHGLLF
jgi:hypothetical protein